MLNASDVRIHLPANLRKVIVTSILSNTSWAFFYPRGHSSDGMLNCPRLMSSNQA